MELGTRSGFCFRPFSTEFCSLPIGWLHLRQILMQDRGRDEYHKRHTLPQRRAVHRSPHSYYRHRKHHNYPQAVHQRTRQCRPRCHHKAGDGIGLGFGASAQAGTSSEGITVLHTHCLHATTEVLHLVCMQRNLCIWASESQF